MDRFIINIYSVYDRRVDPSTLPFSLSSHRVMKDYILSKSYTYHVRDQFLVLLEIMYCLLEIRFTVNEFTFSSKLHKKICYLKKYYSVQIIQFTRNYVLFT